MQHDHVLKKLNFEIMIAGGVGGGAVGKSADKLFLLCCCIRDSL